MQLSMRAHQMRSASIRSEENMKMDEMQNMQPIVMGDVLTNHRLFQAFMRHCVSEMNVENLLFLVES